ncbi:hypothetical protein NEOLEDRAFT_300917 [Neolentinus lepideus HHB14362 ss-1]|uniref:Uncharacterized protein n=1 Tax=Neolentinus lepideus HHB14362 ss-1 TaxID=1314782 RepID=A0A165VQF7_9AGAM|nr:hypothetical protein NEOLEDRAFT_300917 [Neolentinus lepideus HHB14362 ss-1]
MCIASSPRAWLVAPPNFGPGASPDDPRYIRLDAMVIPVYIIEHLQPCYTISQIKRRYVPGNRLLQAIRMRAFRMDVTLCDTAIVRKTMASAVPVNPTQTIVICPKATARTNLEELECKRLGWSQFRINVGRTNFWKCGRIGDTIIRAASSETISSRST